MNRSLFFLCDLAHTSQGPNAETAPYPIGCVKSYFHAHGPEADIRLFKLPEPMAEAFIALAPGLVGFSNYMWNADLGLTMAAEIKRRAPETLIVFGGPNYPQEAARQKQWLLERPVVDVYVIGEGEEPFLNIGRRWLETGSIEAVKRAGITGTHAIIDGELVKTNAIRRDGRDDAPRITDLDATPSPYLQGYLDEFLANVLFSPLTETNRGCPFSCAFCVDGVASRGKVHRVSAQRFEAELRYIAQRARAKYLTLADTNFGMYPEDVGHCRVLAQVRREFGFPLHLQVTTGKNQLDRIVECSELLEGALRLGASVQSLDPEVLANIKRSNISYDALIAMSQRVSDTEANTYSEVIIPLPGDSKVKHMDTVSKLVQADFNQVRIHTCMILEGSELATAESRAKFGLKTRFRVVPRSFGAYPFGDRVLPSVEVEEVCVESDDMPFADYLECRRFDLTVALFFNDRLFHELVCLIRILGARVDEWLSFVHGRVDQAGPVLADLYAGFTAETESELSPDRDGLAREIKTVDGVLASYVEGARGNNVLFNTQALAYVMAMDEMHRFAYGATRDFLVAKGVAVSPGLDHYLTQLEAYSRIRKAQTWLQDLDGEEVASFDFDVLDLEERGFQTLPDQPRPTTLRFYFSPWQRDFIADQLARYGRSRQGLGKMFSRVPIKKLQRSVARQS